MDLYCGRWFPGWRVDLDGSGRNRGIADWKPITTIDAGHLLIATFVVPHV